MRSCPTLEQEFVELLLSWSACPITDFCKSVTLLELSMLLPKLTAPCYSKSKPDTRSKITFSKQRRYQTFGANLPVSLLDFEFII